MIRAYIYAAGAAAVLAGLVWGGRALHQAGAAGVRLEYVLRDAAAAEEQRVLTRDRNRINQGIDHATVARQSAASRAAAVDRAVVGELRDALAARSRDAGDPTTTGCADDRRSVGILAELVSESAGLLAEGAAVGAGLATQAAGLRDYVARVCNLPVR